MSLTLKVLVVIVSLPKFYGQRIFMSKRLCIVVLAVWIHARSISGLTGNIHLALNATRLSRLQQEIENMERPADFACASRNYSFNNR